jgi:hypothetical protein
MRVVPETRNIGERAALSYLERSRAKYRAADRPFSNVSELQKRPDVRHAGEFAAKNFRSFLRLDRHGADHMTVGERIAERRVLRDAVGRPTPWTGPYGPTAMGDPIWRSIHRAEYVVVDLSPRGHSVTFEFALVLGKRIAMIALGGDHVPADHRGLASSAPSARGQHQNLDLPRDLRPMSNSNFAVGPGFTCGNA